MALRSSARELLGVGLVVSVQGDTASASQPRRLPARQSMVDRACRRREEGAILRANAGDAKRVPRPTPSGRATRRETIVKTMGRLVMAIRPRPFTRARLVMRGDWVSRVCSARVTLSTITSRSSGFADDLDRPGVVPGHRIEGSEAVDRRYGRTATAHRQCWLDRWRTLARGRQARAAGRIGFSEAAQEIGRVAGANSARHYDGDDGRLAVRAHLRGAAAALFRTCDAFTGT